MTSLSFLKFIIIPSIILIGAKIINILVNVPIPVLGQNNVLDTELHTKLMVKKQDKTEIMQTKQRYNKYNNVNPEDFINHNAYLQYKAFIDQYYYMKYVFSTDKILYHHANAPEKKIHFITFMIKIRNENTKNLFIALFINYVFITKFLTKTIYYLLNNNIINIFNSIYINPTKRLKIIQIIIDYIFDRAFNFTDSNKIIMLNEIYMIKNLIITAPGAITKLDLHIQHYHGCDNFILYNNHYRPDYNKPIRLAWMIAVIRVRI